MRRVLNLLVFIFFVNFSFSATALEVFEGVKDLPKEGEATEASSSDDTIKTSDLCCDRDQHSDWAQELSPQESLSIVNQWLADRLETIPSGPASKGQR